MQNKVKMRIISLVVIFVTILLYSCVPDSDITEQPVNNYSTQKIICRNYITDTAYRGIYVTYNDSVDLLVHFSGFPIIWSKYKSTDSLKMKNVNFVIFDDKHNILAEEHTMLKNNINYNLITYSSKNRDRIYTLIVESNNKTEKNNANAKFINFNKQYDSLYYYIDNNVIKLAYGEISKSYKIFNSILNVEGVSSNGKRLILDDIQNTFLNNNNYLFIITEGSSSNSTTYYNIKE